MQTIPETYNDKIVRQFTVMTVVWGIVGMAVGVFIAAQLYWPALNFDIPWLSYGRLRPIHTNTVFWGWSTLAMLALALYVVPKTSQRKLFSIPLAWVSLWLINVSVLVGDVFLAAGITNGGQEYREYIWPVTLVFAIGVILVAYNLIRTIADRGVEEIYISNWYIMGGFLWTSALVTIAYLPF